MQSWWAVFTEPRRELLAAERLTKAGLVVYCPHVRVTRRRVMARQRGWRQRVYGERVRERHRVTTEDEAVLPRYLFARGDLASLLATPGVVDVVRAGREALPVPHQVVAACRELLGEPGEPPRPRAVAKLSEALKWKVGDQAVLRPGTPLAGLMVTLRSVGNLDTTGVVEGWLHLFGQSAPVSLKYEDVERVIAASPVTKARASAQIAA